MPTMTKTHEPLLKCVSFLRAITPTCTFTKVIGRSTSSIVRHSTTSHADLAFRARASASFFVCGPREFVEGPGDARITDLHVWRIGPEAHAAIVSVTGGIDGETVRKRLRPVHELGHLTVECR